MRRIKFIAAVLAAAMLAAAPVSAQVKLRNYRNPNLVKPPVVLMIKPSQALRIALGAAPRAKPLGVQLRGPLYIVKLKQGNRIVQMRIDAASGAIR
jgi:uncharacterized membrane protein YkoI